MRLAQGPAARFDDFAETEDSALYAAQAGRRQADLADMLRILQRRWRLAGIIATAIFAFALAYLVTAPRLYTGVASILIDARSRVPVGDMSAGLNAFPDAILVESQVRLISSESVLRRVVTSENLVDSPEFPPPRPGLKTRLLGLVGLGSKAAAKPDDPVARIIGTIASHIAVKRSERTYIADIEVTWRDPAMAARLANAVAKAYFADQQATREESAARDSEWVLAQVQEMQASLQTAETRAEDYRREHGIIDVNGKLLIEQNLSEAATALVQARAKVAETRARYDQIERVMASGHSIDTLPDALKSPAIDRLKSQYADISRQQATLRETLGARHPALLESDQQLRDVRRLINEELKRIEAGMANEYQTAQANVTMLESQVQSLKANTATSNENRVKLAELQRDVDARRAVLDRFLRARDTVKEQASDTPIGRLIAPASVPTSPSSPKTTAVLALGAITGLLLGLGGALATDSVASTWSRWRRVVATRTGQDPERFDDLSEAGDVYVETLGPVPSPFDGQEPIESRPRLVERLRTVWPTVAKRRETSARTDFYAAIAALPIDVEANHEAGGFTTLVFTSEPGNDSRTTLALGVAERFARLGLRPIIIDAEGGRTLMRDLVEPGAAADLLDLMGTTRVCYYAASGSAEAIALVPKLADEARVVQRLRGRDGLRHLEGLRGHFDVVLFDGPSLADTDRLREVIRSSSQVFIVATPNADLQDLEGALEAAAVPVALRVGTVRMQPVVRAAPASAAA